MADFTIRDRSGYLYPADRVSRNGVDFIRVTWDDGTTSDFSYDEVADNLI